MKLKKILMFLPIIAVLAFAGCMTPQVELRQEYDKLVKAITADGKTTLTTFAFTVKGVSKTEKEADVYFLTGAADIPYVMSSFGLPPDTPVKLHWYNVSEDSDKIPVWNFVFTYVKTDGEWKINSIKDGPAETALSAEDLANLLKGGAQ